MRELKRDSTPRANRIWYNDWVRKNAKGKVLDVGKSRFWDYGFPTIDIDRSLEPTFLGDICRTAFPSDYFEMILCNGMYECVKDPQKMVDEVYRLLVSGGKVIFGFVGKDYKPDNRQEIFYTEIDFKEFKIIEKKDFDKEYHFIICMK
jgi:SAM-dependent methyltransferase